MLCSLMCIKLLALLLRSHMQFLAARSLCKNVLHDKYSIPIATSAHIATRVVAEIPYIIYEQVCNGTFNLALPHNQTDARLEELPCLWGVHACLSSSL